jgi:hypothetical protein
MFRAAVADEHLAASVLPGVNTLVRISVGAGPEPDGPLIANDVPSRVEDLVAGAEARELGWPGDVLWVAAPHYGGDVEIPERGTSCHVSWPTPVGMFALPASFEGRDLVGPTVRAWRLRVRGPAARVQRRRYVRVPWTGAVTVQVLDGAGAPDRGDGRGGHDARDGHDVRGDHDARTGHDARADRADRADRAGHDDRAGRAVPDGRDGGAVPDEPEGTGDGVPAGARALAGTMVDLSEGGIRCMLPPPQLPAGQRIVVVFPVAGRILHCRARVVWTRACTTPVGTFAETGVAFDDPEEHGDLLRPVVFAEQRRARRAGLS